MIHEREIDSEKNGKKNSWHCDAEAAHNDETSSTLPLIFSE